MKGKSEMIEKLRAEINALESYKAASDDTLPQFGLKSIELSFPLGSIPTGVIHEFITCDQEDRAATGAFLSGLLAVLMQKEGTCVWVGTQRALFPPSLARFGIDPDQIIFIDAHNDKQVLWVTEEALKCDALAAVVAELRDLDFNQSRRLQLACQRSRVTGFMIRTDPARISTTASVARWVITHRPSEQKRGMPGVGIPRWQVELQRVRNGSPGVWQVSWKARKFVVLPPKSPAADNDRLHRNTG